jgi:hypothetical protein
LESSRLPVTFNLLGSSMLGCQLEALAGARVPLGKAVQADDLTVIGGRLTLWGIAEEHVDAVRRVSDCDKWSLATYCNGELPLTLPPTSLGASSLGHEVLSGRSRLC